MKIKLTYAIILVGLFTVTSCFKIKKTGYDFIIAQDLSYPILIETKTSGDKSSTDSSSLENWVTRSMVLDSSQYTGTDASKFYHRQFLQLEGDLPTLDQASFDRIFKDLKIYHRMPDGQKRPIELKPDWQRLENWKYLSTSFDVMFHDQDRNYIFYIKPEMIQ